MAMLLRTPVFRANPPFLGTFLSSSPNSSSLLANFRKSPKTKRFCLCAQFLTPHSSLAPRANGSVIFASPGEATEMEKPQEPGVELDDVESGVGVDSVKASEAGTSDVSEANADESASSAITTALRLYKEALQSNDETKLAEIEALLKSIEDVKDDLEKKVLSLSEELTVEKIRVLRISADFDNFRRRTETERLSLVTNAQREAVENLLPVLDNFERARTQIKVVTEGEEMINNSYLSIYKQFAEILASVGVVPVETVGNSFDPMVQDQVGLNPIQLLGKMLRLLNHTLSGFTKTWKSF